MLGKHPTEVPPNILYIYNILVPTSANCSTSTQLCFLKEHIIIIYRCSWNIAKFLRDHIQRFILIIYNIKRLSV